MDGHRDVHRPSHYGCSGQTEFVEYLADVCRVIRERVTIRGLAQTDRPPQVKSDSASRCTEVLDLVRHIAVVIVQPGTNTIGLPWPVSS